MSRSVAAAVLTSSLAMAAALYFRAPEKQASGLERARHEQLLQRIDRLEQLVTATVASRSGTVANPAISVSHEPAAIPPVAAIEPDSGLRAGNAVVERGLQAARWSQQDAIELSVATAALSGPERAEIYARLAVAINEERLPVDPAALGL